MPNIGACLVCDGTGRIPANHADPYHKRLAGYDKTTDTAPCRNCGGQTMSCVGTGQVWLRPDGTPCVHEYEYKLLGNCWHGYTCKHCGYSYTIDSGD